MPKNPSLSMRDSSEDSCSQEGIRHLRHIDLLKPFELPNRRPLHGGLGRRLHNLVVSYNFQNLFGELCISLQGSRADVLDGARSTDYSSDSKRVCSTAGVRLDAILGRVVVDPCRDIVGVQKLLVFASFLRTT
jgi:hypothetical protein